jgi:hypothetical protein
MDEKQWNDASVGTKIAALIDELRQGNFEALELTSVRQLDDQLIVAVPEGNLGRQAIVVVLHSDEAGG